LLVAPLLPHWRNTIRAIVSMPEYTLVYIIEYLVEIKGLYNRRNCSTF
jgi:hypothetical protein